jgi:hypothetical protein
MAARLRLPQEHAPEIAHRPGLIAHYRRLHQKFVPASGGKCQGRVLPESANAADSLTIRTIA